MASVPIAKRKQRRSPLSTLRFRPVLVLCAAVLVIAATYGLPKLILQPALHSNESSAGQNGAPIAAPDGPTGVADGSIAQIDEAIGVWSANLARDAADFVSATNLADLYYARARVTGNIDDYTRAQAAVDKALAAYPAGTGAQLLRAQLLFATHDFIGALHDAQAIVDANPGELAPLATVGDAQLELGQYDAAQATFSKLSAGAPGPAVTARQAHLAALRGDVVGATRLAQRAVTESRTAGADPVDRSWYEYLAGYLAFQFGDLGLAQREFHAATQDAPGSFLAIAGLARTRAAQGATDEAIQLYTKGIAIVPQPEFLAALGDLYSLKGDTAQAQSQYALVRAIAHLQSIQAQVYNRQLVLFDSNHGDDPAQALVLAAKELAVRKDVYGWDAYAWALYANGRFADADAAIHKARAIGTVDTLLDYHQGMIAAALGNPTEARRLLTDALNRNPGFDPLQAVRARAALARLGAAEGHR